MYVFAKITKGSAVSAEHRLRKTTTSRRREDVPETPDSFRPVNFLDK